MPEKSPSTDATTSGEAPPPGPRRGGRLPWAVAALLLAAAAGAAWYAYARRKPRDDTRLVLQGDVDVRQVNLAFKVDGRIAELAVDEGDAVKAGDVLARLDRVYFEDELKLARARLENQRAALERLEHGSRPEEIAKARDDVAARRATAENARLAFERREALFKRGAVTKEEYDAARASAREADAKLRSAEEALKLTEIGPREEDIDAARAQLRAEEAALSQAERRLTDSALVAPGEGIILTRARERGAIVAPGETVFALTLTSPVWVRTYVDEPDLGRVRPGMRAEVRTDGKPSVAYRGHVGFISPTAEFTPKSVETRALRTDLVYRLRIVVDNPDGGLRQGMPVTVVLDTGGAP